ncbi:protein kinase [Leptolyngbya sp. FACHB-671]|nr:protein kinase [Leptolyngbya sp. FACHB-671]MBD2067101.1 protein kinase [Leptolyngbya sp. FACHB-671]
MKIPVPGDLLDRRYRVLRTLAKGGFGQTYVAEDTRLPGNPWCVVKQLKPASDDPKVLGNARRLFLTEAETLQKLGKHDQIPQLLAYFEEEDEFYLVQELIEGHTLTFELRQGKSWSEIQVCHMLHQVLSVLAFIHHQGVIHRDIKPDNLIRRRHDHKLVLVDFGIVKQVVAQGQPKTTIVAGTPGYMPTEQCLGKPRPSSDLYALGIIGVQALTGLSPSDLPEDPDTGELIWQPLAPVGDELVAILRRMVRFHFKDRYQSAEEVLQAIEPFYSRYRAATLPSLIEQFDAAPKELGQPDVLSPTDAVELPPLPVRGVFSAVTEPDSTVVWQDSVGSDVLPESPAVEEPESTAFMLPVSLNDSPLSPPEDVLPVEQTDRETMAIAPLPTSATPRWQALVPSQLRSAPLKIVVGAGLSVMILAAAVIAHFANIGAEQTARITDPTPDTDSRPIPLVCDESPLPPLPSGEPDYEYSDGVAYYGSVGDGDLPADGRGTMIFPNGYRYDGEFQNGKRNGCGTLTFENGRKYVGQFEDDQFSGVGEWILESGDRYIGEFKDNRCDGKGKFIFANGETAEGIWQDGKLQGSDLSCDR